MRRAGKKDRVQGPIVAALREAGCSVWIQDLPLDLLVGRAGRTYLLECKDADGGKLTSLQERFLQSWRGQYAIVHNIEEALRAVGLLDPTNPVPDGDERDA